MRQCELYIFYFFFSSRRRHTRLTCDWSSDVCSSDLKVRQDCGCVTDDTRIWVWCAAHKEEWQALHEIAREYHQSSKIEGAETRSEERRVGKECRCRWAP